MSCKYDLLIATGLFPPDIGGPATYSKILSVELPKRGILVKVLSFGEVRHLPKLVRHLVYTWKVFRLAAKSEVIYAQDPVSVGLPVMVACALRCRPYFLKIVGDYAWEQGSQRFRVIDLLDVFSIRTNYAWPVRVLKKIQLSVACRAKKVIVPSEYLKKIVSNWGTPLEKIQVIYNAFEAPGILPGKVSLRQKLDFNGPVITSVGRLVPWKGFPLLIDLIPELTVQFSGLKLFIIGEGPEREKLEKQIIDKKLTNVFLIGRLPQSELLKYVKASDVFALNTSYEGFSHQLLEVMWCETPIVTTAVGGNVELIENGKTGFLVGHGNHNDLKEAIEKILSDHDLADRLAEAAKTKVSEFGKDRMIEKLLNILSLN
ncbi:MAG TPA: glycosyltransferase family 4 protein [Candidatus Paceibacterota bacterium]|nr:glycosyltransferase family 4 protein [Candidatus Woesebacteria bacterium]HOY11309.1 glycosyltransferase family 4 protein [Candidatus Paceibacterota bacterium]HPV33416.1 glycosyltransferase family 4 protein [Candidatus Paceibacterota bacterium]HPY13133.1 glycosyltransferase family 4 protein [Candidatus Paceibacterota bacterium]